MRILFALPGLHRVRRGAEVAFESIAQHLALGGGHEVTLFGSGRESPPRAYRFQRVPAVQPHVATFLSNLLTVEELCFSDKSTLRAQQRLGLDPKDADATKFLTRLRELLAPYGYLPLEVGKHLPSRKANTQHALSPACLLVRLAPAGRRRSS